MSLATCNQSFIIRTIKENDYGDSITSNNLVTRRYENLLYPEVKEADLLREEEL